MSDSSAPDGNPQDPALSTSTQSDMPTTSVRQQANGRCVVTVPKAVARGLAIDDAESDARDVRLGVRCAPEGIALDATVGRLGDGYGVRTASVKSGSVQLSLPRFQALAWGLPGCELAWPHPDDVESATVEPQSLQVGVRGWSSPVESDVDGLDWQCHSEMWATGTGSGLDASTTIPVAAARTIDVEDGGAVRVTFGCADDRRIARLEPVDEAGGGNRVTVSKPVGVTDPRIVARVIPGEFGVLGRLVDGERVGVEWAMEAGRVYGRAPR